MKTVALALMAAGLVGCSTPVKQVEANTPALVLKEPQTRKLATAGTVSVPKGVYEPDFEANNGIYYRAPTHLITKVLGVTSVVRGGIFVPFPPTEEQKRELAADKLRIEKAKAEGVRNQTALPKSNESFLEGVWTDQQEGSGGLLVYAASSPKRIFRVTEPFAYTKQKPELQGLVAPPNN